MIGLPEFQRICDLMGDQAREDIAWAEGIKPPEDADDFALEAIFVICNSGMKNTVARGIYTRVVQAIRAGKPARSTFGHPGKAAAIDYIWGMRAELFAAWNNSTNQLEFMATLPWIGEITKYHLAKNFGMDVVKPDVHLVRLSDAHHTTPTELCRDLAQKTGYRIATIDTVLWRACANGVLDGHTGKIREAEG